MATARVQPALAPRILCGKQLMKKPSGWQHLQVVQLLDVAVANVATGLVALPDQRRVPVALYFLAVCTKGASQLQASVPVRRTPRSSRYMVAS
jgi:hypothetical protein